MNKFQSEFKNVTILFVSIFIITLSSCSSDDDNDDVVGFIDCSNTTSTFAINLNPNDCSVDIESQLGVTSQYDESITGTTRNISINGIANHLVGNFPNPGNPNSISVATDNFSMTTQPQLSASSTGGQGYTFGVLFSGVAMDPYTGEFFQGSGGINMAWNITTLQNQENLGLDCNNAHVQPTGRYHYHGSPSRYVSDNTIDGSQMVKIGYAGDGFPIYYKYGFADDGTTIIALESGYQLKTRERGGDGNSAPDGCPDGLYFQDYEYVDGISTLDACNGRTGKTPESNSEYYYVLTDNFPSSPLCFSGTPDASFN